MRPIKFRVWVKSLKKMMYVTHLDFISYMCGLAKDEKHLATDNELCNFVGCELMQFTGLKDKHGKEIYEGDIIEVDAGNHTNRIKQVVEYSDCGFYAKGTAYLIDGFYSPKIIGNIYENPKLLKRK